MIGKGFSEELRAATEPFRLGAVTPEEYREALRLIGYPLLPDDEAFRPPPPLPPDLKTRQELEWAEDDQSSGDGDAVGVAVPETEGDDA